MVLTKVGLVKPDAALANPEPAASDAARTPSAVAPTNPPRRRRRSMCLVRRISCFPLSLVPDRVPRRARAQDHNQKDVSTVWREWLLSCPAPLVLRRHETLTPLTHRIAR